MVDQGARTRQRPTGTSANHHFRILGLPARRPRLKSAKPTPPDHITLLDTDQPVVPADYPPLQVRIRLETDGSPAWVVVGVQASGIFTLHHDDFTGPSSARLRIQAWFDRTDLLGSSRSKLVEIIHAVAPIIG